MNEGHAFERLCKLGLRVWKRRQGAIGQIVKPFTARDDGLHDEKRARAFDMVVDETHNSVVLSHVLKDCRLMHPDLRALHFHRDLSICWRVRADNNDAESSVSLRCCGWHGYFEGGRELRHAALFGADPRPAAERSERRRCGRRSANCPLPHPELGCVALCFFVEAPLKIPGDFERRLRDAPRSSLIPFKT